MPSYKKMVEIAGKVFPKHKLFRYGFNLSPVYRRSCGRLTYVSPDLLSVRMKLPLSWKNRNYKNVMYGGSIFSSVDPIPMVQLMTLIGEEYVVWDKMAQINFFKPAKEDLYAEFIFSSEEISEIKRRVAIENEMEVVKVTMMTNKDKTKVFSQIKKTIYIADRGYFKAKRTNQKAK